MQKKEETPVLSKIDTKFLQERGRTFSRMLLQSQQAFQLEFIK
jgi:DNA-dependent RNA polymerase auxiliary subunit epsilon